MLAIADITLNANHMCDLAVDIGDRWYVDLGIERLTGFPVNDQLGMGAVALGQSSADPVELRLRGLRALQKPGRAADCLSPRITGLSLKGIIAIDDPRTRFVQRLRVFDHRDIR